MPEFPFEDFLPKWWQVPVDPEAETENARERLRTKMVSTLMKQTPDVDPAVVGQSGKAQLRKRQG